MTTRTDRPPQMVLDLPHEARLGADDFLTGQPNDVAFRLVTAWPDWPGPALLLTGPQGAGKSHLATIWRRQAGADVIAAAALVDTEIDRLASLTALAIEDIDRLGDDPARRASAERAAFHVLNLAREQRLAVLVTSRVPPGEIEAALPDLRSRLRALPFAEVRAPDDQMLAALLVKLFADRQLKVDPSVITYLVRHMERSAAEAHGIVAELDARALATKRPVTRVLAAEVLGGGIE